MSSNQINDTVRLAGQATALSSELYKLQEECQHKTTAAEISTIADELARLSTTLWHLNDAINADPAQYTDAFNEDLKEITTELTSVFEEISECCTGLQMADANPSSVSWFFKKGRVTRLLKHLEALKGTLVVMRTVLWHGKDYGTHTSDRLAESSPHTMHEDRVILESVLARNRDAILDLHNLANTISTTHAKPFDLERSPSKAGDHHRQLSESTGVDVPPIHDVLPLTLAEKKEQDDQTTPPTKIRRTFSKRGVRLGVHMSILDLSAHEAPIGLKRKWIQQAHIRQQFGHGQPGNRGGLTALPELSRISEVDTAAGSLTNLNLSLTHVQHQIEPIIPTIPESLLTRTPTRTPNVPQNTPANLTPVCSNVPSHRKGRSSTVSSRLGRLMSKISITNLRSPTRGRSRTRESSEVSSTSKAKGKEKEVIVDEDKDEMFPKEKLHPANLNPGKENRPTRMPFLDTLKHKFEKSPLTTPDFDKEFEYNRV